MQIHLPHSFGRASPDEDIPSHANSARPARRTRRPINCVCVHLVEIWLSILVRKVRHRGNFRSMKDLRKQVLAFIDYFNRTMAKPFKWT